ncbi:MAG: YcgL domain-containing protein [Arenicellales bacterium]|jgi:uncharacterized protein YcgL (UPF0745 family)
MKTWVYKGSRKADTYLYIVHENDFSRVPQIILELMGSLKLVLDVDLAKRDRLALVDIDEVKNKLVEQGFFIQMPPGDKQPETLC